MVAVTQVIPDLLGGISQQPDNQKDTGDLSDSINAYPDVTLGLIKRPGLQYIYETTTGLSDLDSAKWFFINRDGDEKYIGCIQPGDTATNGGLRIFNAATGVESTITYSDGKSYLQGTKDQFRLLTLQDTTIIVNRSKVVGTRSDPTFNANRTADIVIQSLAYATKYQVRFIYGGTNYTCTYQSLDNKAAYGGVGIELLDVRNGLAASISAKNIPGLIVDTVATTPIIQLRFSNGSFSQLEQTTAPVLDRLSVFSDSVADISELPGYGENNRIVKVLNSSANEDDYFARFRTHDNSNEGEGYWEETKSPSADAGLDNSTMPHELINTGLNTFTFKQIAYTERLVGDDLTNSHPSFVNKTIKNVFNYSNRLGFLSEDNVVLSAASQPFNFYFRSARVLIDSDPIDTKAQSEKPVLLEDTLSTPQGLLLFTKDQQFLLRAADNVVAPSTVSIRKVSGFEVSLNTPPLLLGTTAVFLTRSNQFRRVFALDLNGPEEPPTVTELSKKVHTFINASVDNFIENEQNQFIVASRSNSKTAFFYNYYVEGDKVLVKSWNKWKLPGNVKFIASDQEDLFFVTKDSNSLVISKADITQSPSNAIIVNSDGVRVNPSMDYFASPSSIVYDSTTNSTKCYLPYTDKSSLTPVLVINGNTSTGTYTDSGYNITPERGTDGTGDYFIIPLKNMGADTLANRQKITVGYRFNYEVELPTIYFRLDDDQADFTAGLIISRIKISCGLSGAVGYKLKAKGSAEWVDVSPVPKAGFYLADDIPLNSQREVIIPVHQQNTNFILKLYDTTPFPISVGSIMWEGKYSPRFYRRQ